MRCFLFFSLFSLINTFNLNFKPYQKKNIFMMKENDNDLKSIDETLDKLSSEMSRLKKKKMGLLINTPGLKSFSNSSDECDC